MKTIFSYLTLFLVFPFLISAQMCYTVKINKSDFSYTSKEAKNGKSYQKILNQNLVNSQEVGAPELPVKFIKLIIPSQEDVNKINSTFQITQKKLLSNKIYPTQYDVPTTVNFTELEFVEPDPDIYESDKPFPQNAVELIHSGYLDNNNHIITLKVTPFQYYPKVDELELLDNIEIELSFLPNDHEITLPQKRTYKTQELWDNALKSIVDNDYDIPGYQHKPILTTDYISEGNNLKKTGAL